MMTEC